MTFCRLPADGSEVTTPGRSAVALVASCNAMPVPTRPMFGAEMTRPAGPPQC
ncbi:hypothetical protein V4U86_12790 [Mycobacterium sp. AMU20-3851]|uniref:hypothetical protein n=1 Tax=Mycobacterium sp. AMU20-3851 TaxID=3122055 RepID=UPI003754F5DA